MILCILTTIDIITALIFGRIILNLKFCLTAQVLIKCYGISAGTIAFNFPVTNLGEFIIDKRIIVDPVPRSFLATAKQYWKINSPNPIKYVLPVRPILNTISKLYTEEEKLLINQLVSKTWSQLIANQDAHNYLCKIMYYILDGYQITNISELKYLIDAT